MTNAKGPAHQDLTEAEMDEQDDSRREDGDALERDDQALTAAAKQRASATAKQQLPPKSAAGSSSLATMANGPSNSASVQRQLNEDGMFEPLLTLTVENHNVSLTSLTIITYIGVCDIFASACGAFFYWVLASVLSS